ncbi:MAG: response regulator FixJ [Alphaproteobacteria bacterium]|jgi:FixJ family two-component response regulator|nr:DNA-binding response regulator [Rhodospirillaceae bacterium]MDP6404961.1 response regulator FixJ [Alphaproteobacteria bacterium]MDP6623991.1 response regulator FixJ [Alphaproteobacteria bacterium]|tara:strand:- start:762 stop:1388 length:627 start_codon:yes stop_codon:yes gene_type:complete
MTTTEQIVYVVDDDPAIRDSLQWLLTSVDLKVRTFSSGQELLDQVTPDLPGCLLIDVRMPGMSGLELQHELTARGIKLPIVIITGHGDVQMAVRAMKAGALDFIEKPFNDQEILEVVQRAVDRSVSAVESSAVKEEVESRIASLTPRERQVLELVVTGLPNRGIALELGRSEKTVEFHRANVMEKMQAKSLADLMKMVMTVGEIVGNP